MASVRVVDLIADAARELVVIGPLDSPGAELSAIGLSRLNQILDLWNARREAVYAERTFTGSFVSNQQDYTIGPTGADFTVDIRPVTIEAGNVLLDNVTPVVSNPINIRDYQWWASLTVKNVTSQFATDCYYETAWPNGILHFWPKPQANYGLELFIRQLLSSVASGDTINLPPGYQRALTLTLAEDLSEPLARVLPPNTARKAMEARAAIFRNNEFSPLIMTQDAGMPSRPRNRSSFNYRTGLDINVNR